MAPIAMVGGLLTSTASPWARRVVDDLRWAQESLPDHGDLLGCLAARPGLLRGPEVQRELENIDFTDIRSCTFGPRFAPPEYTEKGS
eukprot:3988061-Pyramimonas_sp.AAC.1